MTNSQVVESPLASDEFFWKERCQHHWVIETANGPTSQGECKLCGSRREFSNNPEAVVKHD